MVKALRTATHALTISTSTTNYTGFGGYNNYSTTELDQTFKCRPGGIFTNFLVKVFSDSVPNTRNNTTTVRLRKNAANANNVVSIPASTSGDFEDTSSSDTFADGDNLTISVVTTGTSGSIILRYFSIVFDTGTSDTVTQLGALASGTAFSIASTSRYVPITAFMSNGTTLEDSQAAILFKSACTLKNLQARVSANTRTTTTTIRTRKNLANGNQAVSITSTATGLFEDTTNTDSIAVDDTNDIAIVTGTGSGTLTLIGTMISVYSANNISYLTTAGNSNAVGFGNTHYHGFGVTSGNIQEADAAIKVRLPNGGTVKNLSFNSFTNTCNGASTWTLRKNGADTALTTSIAAFTTGWFHDTSNTVSVISTDLINFEITIGGSSGTNSFRLTNAELEVNTTQQYDRPISESSVSISDSASRVQVLLKPISESSINTNETLSRLQALIRTINEDTITTDETLSRLQALTKNISEDSINIDQTIQALRPLFANLTEDQIKYYYSLLTYKS